MRLLIVTPTWLDEATGAAALHPEVAAAIEAQQLRDEWQFDWRVTLDNPYPIGDHRNVLHQYQQAREYFLQHDYAALLTVEHDNLLPDAGAVQRLLDTPGDVIYAPYLLRHDPMRLSAWKFRGTHALGQSLSNYPRDLRNARQEIIWRVSGAGMGCTLFRRNAIEAVPFEASAKSNPCPDLGFALKALQAGLESFGRFDVPVKHYHDGVWLDPYPVA
jgi:hypothetical protein